MDRSILPPSQGGSPGAACVHAGEDRTGVVTALGGWWRPKPSPGDQLAILYADGICEQVM